MDYHFRRWLILLVLGSAPATIAASGDIVTEELNRTRGVGTSDAVIHLDHCLRLPRACAEPLRAGHRHGQYAGGSQRRGVPVVRRVGR